jgi:thymidylate synthase
MSKVDLEFQKLCKTIVANGREYENKNRGVKRLQIPSYTFRHEFHNGFPAITNKKVYWKGIVGELIWFLRGDNDVKYLNENGIKIWNKDAYNWYKKHFGNKTFEEFEKIGIGSVGQNYSVQWRNFNGNTDQIKDLVRDMKIDIMSSRLKVNAWNPSEVNQTALPPCHSEFQVIGVPLEDGKFGFELHWNQRSVDTFLGLPFNIASYGLLAKILEQLTGFKALAIEGTLKCVHFYDNQYKAVEKLLQRNPETHGNCEVELPTIDNISEKDIDTIFNEYKISDFKLIGYTSDEEIKVEMLSPKELSK